MQLTSREKKVLTTIIEQYILNAHPVGSRIVARESALALSPASMRNTMADLTDKGYLEQPHTSAGRVPTPRAFRHYLATVLAPGDLSDEARQTIRKSLDETGMELPDMLRQASQALSSCAKQVAMTLAPSGHDVRWRSIDFVSVRTGLIMAVLVLDGGVVQNRMLPVAEDFSRDDLIRFGNYLNHHFVGQTLSGARAQILRELDGAGKRLDRLYRHALTLASATMDSGDERDLFVGGAGHLLDHPEFTEAGTVRELLDLFDERSRLLELLDRTIEAGEMKITFSNETGGVHSPSEYSVISSPYGGDGGPRGVVGVIGPLRMDYAKVVPAVDFTAQVLTELIRNRY
ncbi:heat-inducible transcriptional repressor HrcA [Desulfovibrio ferrophilus]|uniref:Heat-inducible transcription repressor HrcA n=1 Tax=Desulfovibrio ferrophilus TaxID=241368 RepID=A0A2Z6AVA6_9BACT|nr:heat-inducible transcriptional repressor HrcA [Desulfovibrio ferrophilus]BBD07164.1 heat-inducible transcription repressor hrcA [Desulfovibrio ferrophilus]